MVLVATIGISALSLVLIDARKNSKMISSRFIADADIDRAVNYIGSLMMTPNNCSATFAGQSIASINNPKELLSIYKCPSDASEPCTEASKVVAINFDDWVMFPNETAKKAKLVSVNYELEKYYYDDDYLEDNYYEQASHINKRNGAIIWDWYESWRNTNYVDKYKIRPTYYKLTLKFVKNLGWSNGKMVMSNKSVSFHVPVVTKLYNDEGVAIPDQETIIACPINPKSAIPYYNPFPDE
jgi:hypothetical protein